MTSSNQAENEAARQVEYLVPQRQDIHRSYSDSLLPGQESPLGVVFERRASESDILDHPCDGEDADGEGEEESEAEGEIGGTDGERTRAEREVTRTEEEVTGSQGEKSGRRYSPERSAPIAIQVCVPCILSISKLH